MSRDFNNELLCRWRAKDHLGLHWRWHRQMRGKRGGNKGSPTTWATREINCCQSMARSHVVNAHWQAQPSFESRRLRFLSEVHLNFSWTMFRKPEELCRKRAENGKVSSRRRSSCYLAYRDGSDMKTQKFLIFFICERKVLGFETCIRGSLISRFLTTNFPSPPTRMLCNLWERL